MPFFTKELSRAIMARSRPWNNYFKNRNYTNRFLYMKLSNSCVSFLRKTKKRYFDSLNERCVTDDKLFWKKVMPFLSDNVMIRDKIYLSKNDKIIKTDIKQRTI